MVARIIKQHHCGWYYRVIEEGEAQAGDVLECVETGHTGWSVARLFAKFYDPAHRASRDEIEEMAGLERLSPAMRDKIRAKLAS